MMDLSKLGLVETWTCRNLNFVIIWTCQHWIEYLGVDINATIPGIMYVQFTLHLKSILFCIKVCTENWYSTTELMLLCTFKTTWRIDIIEHYFMKLHNYFEIMMLFYCFETLIDQEHWLLMIIQIACTLLDTFEIY